MDTKEDLFVLLLYAAAACFGMSVRWADSRNKKKCDLVKAVADVATAIFCGMLVWGFADWVGVSGKPGYALAGLAGYGGVKTIDIISGLIVRIFKKNAGLEEKE